MTRYFAHSENKSGSPWEPLKEHIDCVTKRVTQYASAFDAVQEAMIAGLWHDLGKYSDVFIKRLKGEVSGLDHWSIGAIVTLHTFKERAIAAALAIQGHHIGIQEGSGGNIIEGLDISNLSDTSTHPQQLILTESNWKALLERFIYDGFELPTSPSTSLYEFKGPHISAMLDARMLFSALVDADFVETEAHFEGDEEGSKKYRPTGSALQAEQAFRITIEHLAQLESKSSASSNVQKIRKQLLEECLHSAANQRGIFTLTAPTGSGKTLAMLAFALKQAIVNPEIRRIVMVVPFLSIIEQTADVYRRLLEHHFGSNYILEHHSLADEGSIKDDSTMDRDNVDEARRTARLLTENWDAPLILTTSVQFFDSLFANRPAKCRKLHRLANSIILFDEVQTIPPRIAVPSLAALSRLAERYGCTIVFSTATQPAFDQLHDNIKPYATMGWKPQTITTEPQQLFSQARRVNIDWQIDEGRPWESIAEELAHDENARSLCIVNLKRHAIKLVQLLRDTVGQNGLFHLSTNMCPSHRQKVLSDVRERLDRQLPCRLISTQCIEAGVDVDFPIVWRAFGPLDGIAQAAGRCNREGKLDGKGRMVVFLPEKERDREYLYPPGGYKEATETTKTLYEMKRIEAREKGNSLKDTFDIYNPDLFNKYYRLLYDLTGMAEFDPDRNELTDAIHRRSFVDVSRRYQVISQNTINVLVPYKDEIPKFNKLNDKLTIEKRLTRDWIREARPLTISIYRPKNDDSIWQYLEPAPLGRGNKADDWFIYLNKEDYDPLLGLNPKNKVDAWTV